MSMACEEMGLKFEVHHQRGGQPHGQGEINVAANTLTKKGGRGANPQVRVCRTSRIGYGKTLTFMPKPLVGDNGRACMCTVVAEGCKALFAGDK